MRHISFFMLKTKWFAKVYKVSNPINVNLQPKLISIEYKSKTSPFFEEISRFLSFFLDKNFPKFDLIQNR
jgi:hypothetical protein